MTLRALGRVLDLLSRGNKIFPWVVAPVGEVKVFKRLSSSNCSVDHGAVIVSIITDMIFTAAGSSLSRAVVLTLGGSQGPFRTYPFVYTACCTRNN